ncbi:MAG: PHP domain-containing protein [Thermodesulfobacteriota bacterium]
MKIFDLHIHTSFYSSCSAIDPEELIRKAAELNLDGLAITEHGLRWPDDKFNRLRRIADPFGLILLRGQEISTYSSINGPEGEFLVFGPKHSITADISARELVKKVHEEGGILIAAHPFKLSRLSKNKYYGAGERVYELELDALELYHPDHDEEALAKVRQAMTKLGLPGTGSSDAHQIHEVGLCVTIFKTPIFNEEDLIREIRAGHIQARDNRKISS